MEANGIVLSPDPRLRQECAVIEEIPPTIEALAEKMKKMMAMRDSGSDIYFGGFSHMKRFSFFYQLSNWFAPFSFDVPPTFYH